MIIRKDITKAPKGQQTTGRGAPPAKSGMPTQPRRGDSAPALLACHRMDARTSCRPFRANVYTTGYRGSCVPSVASDLRSSGTPVCGLHAPSGL